MIEISDYGDGLPIVIYISFSYRTLVVSSHTRHFAQGQNQLFA